MVDQMWRQLSDRLVVDFAMAWIVIAIMVGLGASELRKRPFWLWTVLSLLTGPIAWYLLFVRLPIYIPPAMRTPCPHCGKTISKDAKVCRYCNKLVDQETKDRATELGKQLAVGLFAAKHFLGRTRKAADQAAAASRRAAAAAQNKPPPPTA